MSPVTVAIYAAAGTGFNQRTRSARSAQQELRAMTVHTPNLLTPEEFASLIEVAMHAPEPNIRLGYVAVTGNGTVVTGDGLIRIAQSE
jgi:hypothetical protein